jgi:hypothetical protein
MDIRLIATDDDYKEALAEVERLWPSSFSRGERHCLGECAELAVEEHRRLRHVWVIQATHQRRRNVARDARAAIASLVDQDAYGDV